MQAFLDRLSEHLNAGRTVAVATVVWTRGSTPRKSGARMIVREDGAIDFTIGGGPFEALVIEDAKEALRSGESSLKSYRFLPVGENATGMTCGGEVDVFLEVHRRPARVVIFGGGHVALPLAKLAKSTGLRVAVLDDRREFADRERFAGVDEVVHAESGYAQTDFPLETDDHVVIVTRCHQTDEACLRRVLSEDRRPASVGVVASRRKARVLLARLRQDGYAPELLGAVRTPIGLDLGAETPEEMAVSIVAEILAARAGREARPLSEAVPANVTVQRSPGSSRRDPSRTAAKVAPSE